MSEPSGFLSKPSCSLSSVAIDRYRSIARMVIAMLLLPEAGAGRLECLDDIAQAPLHGFKHFYHAMEMLTHAHASVYCHLIAVSFLFLGDCIPCVLHHFAESSKLNLRALNIIA